MTDLVEKLRILHRNRFLPIYSEAATEIERLQAENERLNKQIANMNHAAHAYDGRLEELAAENESMRARIELLEKALKALLEIIG